MIAIQYLAISNRETNKISLDNQVINRHICDRETVHNMFTDPGIIGHHRRSLHQNHHGYHHCHLPHLQTAQNITLVITLAIVMTTTLTPAVRYLRRSLQVEDAGST